MTFPTQRSVFRWIHLILAIPIVGYIYSPFDKLADYAPLTRFVFLPLMVLTGLWMWKGHVVRRLLSSRTPERQQLQQSER
jgi:thiosulfate reductase cytochrome b subunit